MKKTFLLLLTAIAFFFTHSVRAQEQRQMLGCIDPTVRMQADAIKQHYVKQGFKVYRDAMINMESMVPTAPIYVQLMRGHLYEIIFVGNPRAVSHRMMIYDSNDQKLDEKFVTKHHDDEATNFIIYEFAPDRTDAFVLEFMTRLKNENFCGSICILAADASKGQVKYTPYTP